MDAHESTDEVDLFMIATPSIRGPNKGSSSNIDALNSYDEALAEAEFQSAASPPPLTKAEQRKLRAKKRKEFSREQRKERVKRKKENEHEESGLVTAKHVAETSYFFRDGFRCVKPYSYIYEVRAKPRWYGKPLAEAVQMDFRTYSPRHWDRACALGLLQVNSRIVTPQTIIKHKDLIQHRVHRHEPPVLDAPIKIVYEDDRLVAIDKPASIPIHPSGRYRHNTIMFILAHENRERNLYVVHRLDRLTSGVLIMAKSRTEAGAISEMIRSSAVQKEYLARVEGVFPEEPVEVDQPIYLNQSENDICKVDPRGKPSQTTFYRVSTNGKESVVRCLPKTGRTHQIRVHLKFLGFPITNDPLYNPNVADNRGSVYIDGEDAEGAQTAVADSKISDSLVLNAQFRDGDLIDMDLLDPIPICPDCRPGDPTLSRFKDPSKEESLIYLHALSYKSDVWDLKTEPPAWATL